MVEAHLYAWGRFGDLPLFDAGDDIVGYFDEGGLYLAVILCCEFDPL